MIKIAIISPVAALRFGIRSMLAGQPDIQMMGEAVGSGMMEVSPEVDVFITAGAPLLARDINTLREVHAQAPVLALVSSADEARVAAGVLAGGIWGLLPLEVEAVELLAAIRALAQGLMVISALFSDVLVSPQGPVVQDDRVEELSAREKEVLNLLAQGLANKQIALRLGISEHTAKFHISSILGKLGVFNRTEAVRKGVQFGFVKL